MAGEPSAHPPRPKPGGGEVVEEVVEMERPWWGAVEQLEGECSGRGLTTQEKTGV